MKKEAIAGLVKAWRTANHMNCESSLIGFDNTPYTEISGNISGAIYLMLGENTQTFDESFTYAALYGDAPDEECTNLLFAEFERRSPEPNAREHVMEFIRSVAEKRGIDVHTMISLILSEWVMRNTWLSECTTA
jgi:hypothetical protein